MNELRTILNSYQKSQKQGEGCVLVTVMSVRGSSYRRPGARMLIRADGEIAGSVSGGCLERDLVQRSRYSLVTGNSVWICYDTTEEGEESVRFSSAGLGCNGVVEILLEPVFAGQAHCWLQALEKCVNERQTLRLSLLTIRDSQSAFSEGKVQSRYWNPREEGPTSSGDDPQVSAFLEGLDLGGKKTVTSQFEWEYKRFSVLAHELQPPLRLVIFGAGHDSVPVARMASILGWDITVVDSRSTLSMPARLYQGSADRVQCSPAEVTSRTGITRDTACLLMSHNYYHDLEVLKQVLSVPVRYVGLLGAYKRGELMLADLSAMGKEFSPSEMECFYSPVGLDFGSETPEEIALSILSEIQTVLTGATAKSLRNIRTPIHRRMEAA